MRKYLFLFVLLISCLHVMAQDELLADGAAPESEFNVAINPTDSNNIIVVTMRGFGNASSDHLIVYYTKDFGLTWEVSDFHGAPVGFSRAGDPVVKFDDLGSAYIVNLSADNNFNVNTILSKSADGGEHWEKVSTVVPTVSDKPWLDIDRYDQSPNKGNIYIPVVGEPEFKMYTLSQDYTIKHEIIIPNGTHLPSVAVKNNGDIIVCTVDIGDPNEIYVQYSKDGGASFEHSTKVMSFPDFTFNMPNISTRFQPTVYVAVDNSGGEYDGRVYVSYTASESNNESFFDVFIVYSDDNGLNWSEPKPVHTNASEKQQYYSSLYVNNNGVLILDWYDRRNYNNNSLLTDFFMGISYDGGDSFTEVQLSTESTDFDVAINANNQFGIGEYHQLVSTDHTAISFWSDGRSNDQDLNIYMAKVSLGNPMVGVEEIGTISEIMSVSNVFPQPIVDNVNVKVKLRESMQLKSEIIDISGKKIHVSDWQSYPQGEYDISIPTDFVPGSYYLKIVSDKGYFKSIKLIKH